MPCARINKIDVYYETHGFGDPVLLLSGLGSDADTWIPCMPAFGNFQAVIPENRGCGRSSKPAAGYSTEIMAEDAVALMQHLGIERAHIVGKSMGGMIAQIIAARYPERVRSLVLACTLMKHDSYGEELLDLGRTLAEKAGLFATYRQAFLLSYSREYCMTNRSRLAEVAEMMKQTDEPEMLRGYLGQSLACSAHDSRSVAKQIKAPSLVIVGKDDTITTPQQSRDLAAAIPRSELMVLPRGSHGFWREFPEDVNPIVRSFLSSH